MLSRLKMHFECFYKISECLSTLDVHLSFVHYILMNRQCTRPSFGTELMLQKAYHPVLIGIKYNGRYTNANKANETLIMSSDFLIGNSIKVSRRTPLVIITGSNMSGKSTFLKQIGIFFIRSIKICQLYKHAQVIF